MLKNYFKIAWRNLLKSKVYSFINVFGLTIGLGCSLLILMYVFDELTFDAFHQHADKIYRVVETQTTQEGKESKVAAVPAQLAVKSKSDLPGIIETARISTPGRANVSTSENTNTFYEDFWVASPGFLRMFDFRLIDGDRKTALSEPHSVIVTEETAKKLFGTTQVLGKSINVDRDSVPCRITGVLENFPANSHITFNLCFSEPSMGDRRFQQYLQTDWTSNFFATYVLLERNVDVNKTAQSLTRLVRDYQGTGITYKRDFSLQPLKKIHFGSAGIENGIGAPGNITYVYVFSIIAFFILFIACINYMNLTTARFANRAKEIAIRKVAGASRKNLSSQFFAEAFVVTLIALFFALILIKAVLPSFNEFTNKQLTIGKGTDYRMWLGIVLMVFFAGTISGIYPAVFQSSFKPLALLKNKIKAGKASFSMRQVLVVSQFALSIIMIIATIVVFLQLKYVNKKDLGFNRDNLVVVDINSGQVRRSAETIKAEFGKLSQVSTVSTSSRVPGEWKELPRVKVKNENIAARAGNEMYFFGADDEFLETYQIKLISGRNFLKGSSVDSGSVIVNETAAKELGIVQALGQTVEFTQIPGLNLAVIGIVKDFNFQSLRTKVAPVVIGFQKNPIQNIDYFTARISGSQVSETIAKMEEVIHSIDPNHLFEYHFLDKQWELFYREDKIRETIFMIAALLTIAIACLGLFGLATYAAEQRIKEIGIRKVLGASVTSIISLLSKDFLKLVVVAAVLAFPVAWWAMHSWLQEFAFHIDIGWWIFFVAGSLAILIALITISFQAIRAATANPVKSLRSE